MNKFIKITIGSTILGLMLLMIPFCYRFQWGLNWQPVELSSLCQATMPPPLSISPVFLLLLGFLLLAVFGLRRKKL
jgi:hypothetical protein